MSPVGEYGHVIACRRPWWTGYAVVCSVLSGALGAWLALKLLEIV